MSRIKYYDPVVRDKAPINTKFARGTRKTEESSVRNNNAVSSSVSYRAAIPRIKLFHATMCLYRRGTADERRKEEESEADERRKEEESEADSFWWTICRRS